MSTRSNEETTRRHSGRLNRRAFLLSFALVVIPVLAKSWPF
jgi:hypothetical protein